MKTYTFPTEPEKVKKLWALWKLFLQWSKGMNLHKREENETDEEYENRISEFINKIIENAR